MPQHTIDHLSPRVSVGQRPGGRWLLHPLARAVRDLFQRAMLLPVARIFARPLRIDGLDNLQGITGGLILAANHQSHADSAILLAALPVALKRRLVIAAAADVMAGTKLVAVLGQVFFGALPFVRTGLALSSVRQAVALLRDGWAVLIFPEGHLARDRNGDELKSGVGLIAAKTSAPVVPVFIAGSRRILPPESHWPRRSPAAVSFGRPILYKNQGREIFVEELRKAIEAAGDALIDDDEPAKEAGPV